MLYRFVTGTCGSWSGKKTFSSGSQKVNEHCLLLRASLARLHYNNYNETTFLKSFVLGDRVVFLSRSRETFLDREIVLSVP